MDAGLVLVRPNEITEQDYDWITEICRNLYTGVESPQVIADIATGQLSCWRIVGDKCEGIVLLKLMTYPGGKELVVWGVAGRNVFQSGTALFEIVQKYANHLGCRWISAMNFDSKYTKFYEKQFDKPAAGTIHIMELKNALH